MKLCSFLIIFLSIALPSHAASLVEMQKQAIQNRYLITQYQANLEASSHDVTIARSRFLPSFDVSYSVNDLKEDYIKGGMVQESDQNSVAYGVITWNLFSGFYDYYNIKSARLLEQAERYRLTGIEQDIQLNVALRYLDIYSRLSSLEVAQESHITLKKLYEDSNNRYSVGLIEKNELLRFKVDLDNASITVKKAEAELAKSLQRLAFEADTHVILPDLDFSVFDQLPGLDDQEQYQATMLENRSEIKTLEGVRKAAALQIKAAQAGRYPHLDVSGSYRKYEDDYISGDGTYYEEEVRGKAVLTLTLFDGFSQQAEVNKARSEKKSVAAQLHELKNALQTELRNLFYDYQVNLENITVAKSSIAQAEENLRITRLKYKEGLEKESDLLDAITNLSRAKNSYVSARTDLFANYFKITRTVEKF